MTEGAAGREEPLRAVRRHAVGIVRLAGPIALSRVGMLLLIVFDVAMLGHADSLELAYYGLANAVQLVLFLVGVGMLIGTAVLTAQASGAGADRECGVIWRTAALHALALGAICAALALTGDWFYRAIGQEADLARGAGKALAAMALGLPGALLFVCSTLFLEALRRPLPGLLVMAAANLLNVALNAWWIPGLGAEGAALATSAVRTLAGIAMAAIVLLQPDAARYNLYGPMTDWRAIGRKLRWLSWPIGLAQGLESCAFSALSIFAGYLGATAVAGFQIAMMAVAFVFMAAIGTGAATAVRVGAAVGRGDRRDMALAGWTGLAAIVVFMAAVALVAGFRSESIGGLFTQEPEVLAVVAPTLVVAALMLIPDGAQGVLMGALRATGDVWIPSAMHLCSFTLVMTPAAWLFGLRLGMGAPGLMLGALCGVSVAALLLAGRFAAISRRQVRRL